MPQKSFRWIIALLILIIVMFFIQYRKEALIKEKSLAGQSNAKLPRIQLRDWRGQAIDIANLKQQVLYIHFIDPRFDYDREFFIKAYREWKDQPIRFLLFSNDPEKIVEKYPELNDKVNIFDTDIEKMRKILGSDKDFSFCYLYDDDRKYYFRTQTFTPYEYLMRYEMKKLIKKEYFRVEEFFGKQKNLRQMNRLKEIMELIPQNKRKFIILGFLTSFCESCTEGTLLREIKRLHGLGVAEAGMLFFETLTPSDVENFKTQMDVKFPVTLARGELLSEWKRFIDVYSPVELATIIVIASGDGEIVRVYYRGCDCFDRFFKYLKEMKTKEEKWP